MQRSVPVSARTTLGVALAISLLFQLPAFFAPHRDHDEQIFLALAENLRTHGRYSLQGLPLLSSLAPHVYDRPLFHHPPLFALLLVPFAGTALQPLAPLVPWLGSACTLVAAWLFLRRFTCGRGAWSVAIPLTALALDPLLRFTSAKLWIDATLGGLCTLSLTLFLLGLGHARRRRLWLAAGVVWGLALLAKAPAAFCALFFLPLALLEARREGSWRALVDLVVQVMLPAAILWAPWLIAFHARYGMLLPDWTRPDAWMIAHSPFVQAAVARPALYYVLKWIVVNPLASVVAATAILRTRAMAMPEIAAWAWFLGTLAIFTALGLWGQGYQMRFVTMAVAPVYLLLGMSHDDGGPRPALARVLGLALLANVATAIVPVMRPDLAELVGIVELTPLGD